MTLLFGVDKRTMKPDLSLYRSSDKSLRQLTIEGARVSLESRGDPREVVEATGCDGPSACPVLSKRRYLMKSSLREFLQACVAGPVEPKRKLLVVAKLDSGLSEKRQAISSIRRSRARINDSSRIFSNGSHLGRVFLPALNRRSMARPENALALQVEKVIVKFRPGIILWAYIHDVVVVHKMKWERQYTSGFLEFEVKRSRLPERSEQRNSGKGAWSQIDKALSELERLRSFVNIQPKYKVGL